MQKVVQQIVHSSIIRNSQKVEAIQMSIDWRMDKQNAKYLFSGSSQYQKEQSTDTCYNIDDPWKPDAERKQPDAKDHIVYDSIDVKCSGWANP